MTKRVFVVIDGGNFYRKLKSPEVGCVHPMEFDYKNFIRFLAGGDKVVNACYYVGQIREEPGNEKSKVLKRDQDRFLARLRNLGFGVKRGYILRSNGDYQEKGVDVQIAVDLCMKAIRGEYDRLVLVSSDTDLIPAIREVKSLGKKVEYVGFDFAPSFALIRCADSRTLLKRENLVQFMSRAKDKVRKKRGRL